MLNLNLNQGLDVWFETPLPDYFPREELAQLAELANELRSGPPPGVLPGNDDGSPYLDTDQINALLGFQYEADAWFAPRIAAWRTLRDAAWDDAVTAVRVLDKYEEEALLRLHHTAQRVVEAQGHPASAVAVAGLAAEAMLTSTPERMLGHLWRFAANHMGHWRWREAAGALEAILLNLPEWEGWQLLPEWPDTRNELGEALSAARTHWPEIVEAAGGLPQKQSHSKG